MTLITEKKVTDYFVQEDLVVLRKNIIEQYNKKELAALTPTVALMLVDFILSGQCYAGGTVAFKWSATDSGEINDPGFPYTLSVS